MVHFLLSFDIMKSFSRFAAFYLFQRVWSVRANQLRAIVTSTRQRYDHKLKIWRDASWFPTLQVSLEETENCRTILFLYDASPEKEPGLERVWIREGLRGVGGRAREFHAHFFLCASSCFRCNLLHVRANTLFYIIWKLSRSERAWHPISTCFALNCLRAWPSRSTVEISREENCEK